jgi:hypothetical protein
MIRPHQRAVGFGDGVNCSSLKQPEDQHLARHHLSQLPEVSMKAREIRKLNRAKEHRVEVRKDVQLEKAVGIALSGCSSKVLKAVTAPSARTVADPSAGNMCLGDVAMYAAGFRKPTDSITAR